MNQVTKRISHWLADPTTGYAINFGSMLAMVIIFSTMAFLAGEKTARDHISEQIEDAADKNYRAIERVDCKLYEVLKKIDPETPRDVPKRCNAKDKTP